MKAYHQLQRANSNPTHPILTGFRSDKEADLSDSFVFCFVFWFVLESQAEQNQLRSKTGVFGPEELFQSLTGTMNDSSPSSAVLRNFF